MRARPRIRRTSEEAQRLILVAAEEILLSSGPGGVSVRAVAERVGMTDAGVHHHFGSRAGLLEALLKHGARHLRRELQAVTAHWLESGPHVLPLVSVLAAFYRRGYSRLAFALHAMGWRDHGSGMLQPVVDALQTARLQTCKGSRPALMETQLAVAAMHQALAVDPTYGAAFRRSAGLTGSAANDPSRQFTWWARTLAATLDLPL